MALCRLQSWAHTRRPPNTRSLSPFSVYEQIRYRDHKPIHTRRTIHWSVRLQNQLPDSGDKPTASPTSVNAFSTARERLRCSSRPLLVKVHDFSSSFTYRANATLGEFGGHLNRMTGYDEIEAHKRSVVSKEANVNHLRKAAREAKKSFEKAVTERSSHQREVNNLLQRRPSWTDDDVLRFTALIRQDHLNEQEELHAKEASQVADAEVEREFNELMRSILSRYHEEQIWSDKIRSASTYGSLAALGLNLVVFILAIVLVEPWKRKRLAQTFEKRIEELSKETRAMIEGALLDLNSEFSLQRGLLEGLTIGSVTRGVGSGESSQIRSDIGENEISAVQSTDGRRLDNPAILLFGGAIAGGLMTWISSRMI